MSKRILGLAALLCAALLASTASAGSPGAARYVSRSHQVIRAQPRMHDATRVRSHHVRTRAVRSAVRTPASRVVRAPATRVTARSATHRRPPTRVAPIKRNWVRCGEPTGQCGRIHR